MKKKGKATSLKHLTGKIASWNNLGYADEDVSRYVEEISRDNLRAIGMYSGLGVFALNLVLVLCCSMNKTPMSLVLLYLAGIVLSAGLIYISSLVIGLLSTVIALLGVAVIITYSPQNGVILLVIAFLISPMGLPLAAIWLLGKVQSLKYAIQDRVYG